MTVLYVDVSHHDWDRRGSNLDWNAVRQATSPVMVARATYGDPGGWNRTSRHFADFQTGAAAAGFTLRGGYHNLIRGDTASIARQVDWLRAELDKHGCNWAMCDIEPYAELVSANMWPRWQDVQRFHDRWYQVDDRVMAWYLPRWFWAWRDKAPSLGEPDLRGLRGPLVQSHYAGGDGSAQTIYANAGGDGGTGWDDFYGGRYPDIWQYSSGADVAGASSNTDINAYRGSLDELRMLLGDGDDMAINETDFNALIWRVQAIIANEPKVLGGPLAGEKNELAARLAGLAMPAMTDEQLVKLADLIAVRLPAPAVPPTPEQIAKAVLDEDHKRSAA